MQFYYATFKLPKRIILMLQFTTFAKLLSAMRWAAVAPTFPASTMVIQIDYITILWRTIPLHNPTTPFPA
jgi:hypothetical protein